MPAVSVIIPNYNHAPYLAQRIESVLNQTFQNFEIIILDDCSPDNSKEIIEQYRSNPKVTRIIYNEVNSGGTFRQWDKGINEATGKYIWIAESDDYADKEFLEILVSKLEEYQQAGLAYAQSWTVDENNQILQSCKEWFPARWQNDFFNQGVDEINNYMVWYGIVNASAVLFRRSIALKIDRNYLNFKLSGDWLFWFQIVSLSGLYYYSKELNYFRQHQNSSSKSSYKLGLEITEGLQILCMIKHKLEKRDLFKYKLNHFINKWIHQFILTGDGLGAKSNGLIVQYAFKADFLVASKIFYLIPGLFILKKLKHE